MKYENGPIILGTIVMEKLGAVSFEHAFLTEYGCIEVMTDREVERKIEKEMGFPFVYAVIDTDDPKKGTWQLCGKVDAPSHMALEYPADFSYRIPDSEITMALNILRYGLDEPHVRESLEKWAVKRLALGVEKDTKEESRC